MSNTSPSSQVTPTRKVELLAAGAAVVTVVLWASAFVSIRSAGEAYSPGALCPAGVAVSRSRARAKGEADVAASAAGSGSAPADGLRGRGPGDRLLRTGQRLARLSLGP